jgi:pimeloyl-ACP methyl ester carboxylesterase
MIRAVLAAAVLALTATGAWAQTAPPADPYDPGRKIVADIQKIVTPNGVQETLEVELGGAKQVINVRGANRDNPILIFIHGGPGSVEMPIAWSFQRPWEDYFTVVQWDQRGAGRSYLLNDPKVIAPTLTPERYRDDAIELIEYLRKRYGQKKVFVMGHSWGSVVGLSVAAKRPDLLYAYIGMGQVIDFRENERLGTEWTIEQARKAGDAKALAELQAIQPYPGTGPLDLTKTAIQRKWNVYYGALAANRHDADFYFHAPRISPEYTPADRKAWDDGSALTMGAMWPQLAGISFQDLNRVDTPVILLMGRQDYTTPAPIADAWLKRLKAPKKQLVWFENSAHLPMLEEPGRTFAALLQDVLPLAKDR